jgi:uncharacterized protein
VTRRRDAVAGCIVAAVTPLVLAASVALAVDVPPLAGKRFHNTSTLLKLSAEQEQAVEEKLSGFETNGHGAQMAVLIIDSLEGEPIEHFSHKVAAQWKIGQRRGTSGDGDHGLLLTLALKENLYRLEVGDGLDGVLPERLVEAIGRGILVPSFQVRRYFEGVNGTIDVLGQSLRGGLIPAPQRSPLEDVGIDRSLIAAGIMLVVAAGFGIVHFLLGGAVGSFEGVGFAWFFVGHGLPDLLLYAVLGFLAGMAAKIMVRIGLEVGISGALGGGSGGFSGGGGGFGGGGASGNW